MISVEWRFGCGTGPESEVGAWVREWGGCLGQDTSPWEVGVGGEDRRQMGRET